MMDFNKKLENDSIVLLKMQAKDFELLYQVGSDEKIWQQHDAYDRWKKEKFKVYFNGGLENKQGSYIITDKVKDKIIGSTRYYDYDIKASCIRIGWTFIAKSYWGTGINYQIKKLMLDYAFGYINKVYFDIYQHNIRSIKALEKLGAKKLSKAYCSKHLSFLLSKNEWLA